MEKTLLLTHFGPILPVLGAKKIFPENPALSRTTSHGILASCQNFEKIKDTILRKHLDRGKDGRKDGQNNGQKDGQTLFYRTLPATAEGPITLGNLCINT